MEKQYTREEYASKAVQANEEGKFLYVYTHEVEYNVEVLEWNKKTIQVQKYDPETGEPMYDEEGNPIMEDIEVDDHDNPIMVEEKIIDPETGEEKTVMVQKHHTETRTKQIAELLIADVNYYVCYEENYTDGTVNPNYEAEKEATEKERIGNLKCTKRVFVLMLQELGITYAQVKELVATDEQASIEWDLCIELQRNNPLIDTFGAKLGLTEEQITMLFKTANGMNSVEELRALAKK